MPVNDRMTLWAEFLGNLLARLVVDAQQYACADACPWLDLGPCCRLWPQRLSWASNGHPRRHAQCIGAGFEHFAPPAWKEAI